MLSDERAELTRLAGEYAAAMECRTQAVVDKCELALVAYVDSLWAELTAEVERLRADAKRWRKMRDLMTHEHSGPNVGWTLGLLLPGDDPDSAIDAHD